MPGALHALIQGIPDAQLLDIYGHAIPCYDTTIAEKIDAIYNNANKKEVSRDEIPLF